MIKCIPSIIICILTLISCNQKASDQYFNAAIKNEDLENYEGAIQDLTSVIKLNPKDYEAYINRGADYAAIGRFEEAISDYNIAIKLDKNNVMAFFNRGNSYSKLNKYDKAVEDYNHAILIKGGENLSLEMQNNEFIGFRSSDVEMAAIKLQRGFAYAEIKNYQKAFSDFDFCVKKKFDYDIALLWRGVCYYNLGYLDEGCRDWELSNLEEAKKYHKNNCK